MDSSYKTEGLGSFAGWTDPLQIPFGRNWQLMVSVQPIRGSIMGSVSEVVSRSLSSSEFSTDLSLPLRGRLEELLRLDDDWDGEGGRPLKRHILVKAADLVKDFAQARGRMFQEPFLAPTFDGFVQLEWESPRRSLEMEATQGGWSVLGAEGAGPDRRYFVADCRTYDSEKLNRFYDWFVGDELVWPSL